MHFIRRIMLYIYIYKEKKERWFDGHKMGRVGGHSSIAVLVYVHVSHNCYKPSQSGKAVASVL